MKAGEALGTGLVVGSLLKAQGEGGPIGDVVPVLDDEGNYTNRIEFTYGGMGFVVTVEEKNDD